MWQVLIVALLCLCPTAGGLAAEPASSPAGAGIAERIVVRTNAAREGRGLPALKTSPQLAAAAQALAEFMAEHGQLDHQADGRTPAQRVEAAGYRWMFVAENIAFRSQDDGGAPDATAKLFILQWWNSPGHQANMLSAQPTEIGAAVAVAPSGAIYAVQVFAAPQSAP